MQCLEALTENSMIQEPDVAPHNWAPHSKHIMQSAYMANTSLPMIKSTTILHSQIHEIAHTNYIGFVLLAQMYIDQRPKKTDNACFGFEML